MERLDSHVKAILMRWQYLKGRECLLDSFTSLRAAHQAAKTDFELALLITILFYEQVCGIRKSTDARWRGGQSRVKEVMKGVLLRQVFYTYVQSKLPDLKEATQHFGTWKYYEKHYRMDVSGIIKADPAASPQKRDADEADEADTPGQKPAVSYETAEEAERKDDSRFVSKSKTLAFLNRVAKNAYENSFTALGQITENTAVLRMDHDCMMGIRNELEGIVKTIKNKNI